MPALVQISCPCAAYPRIMTFHNLSICEIGSRCRRDSFLTCYPICPRSDFSGFLSSGQKAVPLVRSPIGTNRWRETGRKKASPTFLAGATSRV